MSQNSLNNPFNPQGYCSVQYAQTENRTSSKSTIKQNEILLDIDSRLGTFYHRSLKFFIRNTMKIIWIDRPEGRRLKYSDSNSTVSNAK